MAALVPQVVFRSEAQTLFMEMLAGVVVELPSGTIRYATRKLELLFGYQIVNELLGVPLDVLIPERFRAMHANHIAGFSAHPIPRPMGGATKKLFGLHKAGHEFPVEVSLGEATKLTDGTVVVAGVILAVPPARNSSPV